MYFMVVLILFVAASIYFIVKRGLELKDLAKRGEPIQGRIVNKFKRGNKVRNKFLKYEFTTPTGKLITRSSMVSDGVWQQYAENDPIELVYLSDKPQVCSPKYLVDLSREALSKS